MQPTIENAGLSGFNSIIGQQLPIRFLQSFLEKGTIPHALLFSGLPGVGKRSTAKILAMALNCSETVPAGEKPCGRCRACRQLSSGQHPDILYIEPKGAVLRIHQIRDLLAVLAMKPFNVDHRVVILSQAQAMNPEAGNALLKALEEPPSDTTIILTAGQPSDLLPTVVSRCRHIRFNPLSEKHLKELLAARRDLHGKEAETVARMSGGSFSKALQLIDTHWQAHRKWLIQASGLEQPDQLGRRSITAALAFAAQLSHHRESVSDLLDLLKTWIRDLAVVAHLPEQVINRDCLQQLTHARSKTPGGQISSLWQTVEKAQKDIAANANLRLTLDTMALCMIAGATQPGLTTA